MSVTLTMILPAHPVSPAWSFWLVHVGRHSALASHGREWPSNLCITFSWFLDPVICFLNKRKLPYLVIGKSFSISVWDLWTVSLVTPTCTLIQTRHASSIDHYFRDKYAAFNLSGPNASGHDSEVYSQLLAALGMMRAGFFTPCDRFPCRLIQPQKF